MGIIKKILIVIVGNAFYGLTFDQRKSFVNVICTEYYVFDSTHDTVILLDGYNGKEIGSFSRGELKFK